MHRTTAAWLVVTAAALASAACSDSTPAAATAPPAVVNSSLTFGSVTPASGATIQTTGTAPGMFIARGSGLLSIPITIVSNRDLPFAQLNVYLLTGNSATDYCGQNLPDEPTWQPFAKNTPVTLTISGFQIFRTCQVTGVRAMFHNRLPTGLATPPTADFTIVENTLAVNYTIR
jgi:hypothetical protein